MHFAAPPAAETRGLAAKLRGEPSQITPLGDSPVLGAVSAIERVFLSQRGAYTRGNGLLARRGVSHIYALSGHKGTSKALFQLPRENH
jgi:hypothetical protein